MNAISRKDILTVLVTMMVGLLGGCQIISWTVASFASKRKVKAQYELGQVRRVAVFPDNQFYHLSYPPIKDLLAEKLNRKLLEQEIAPETVPYRLLQVHQARLDRQYRSSTGSPAPLDKVAAALGADRVLYVDIRQFRLKDSPAEPVWRARFTTRVRIVDNHGTCLWPVLPQEGYELVVERSPSTEDSKSYQDKLTEELAEQMADKIAKLFYAHREGS